MSTKLLNGKYIDAVTMPIADTFKVCPQRYINQCHLCFDKTLHYFGPNQSQNEFIPLFKWLSSSFSLKWPKKHFKNRIQMVNNINCTKADKTKHTKEKTEQQMLCMSTTQSSVERMKFDANSDREMALKNQNIRAHHPHSIEINEKEREKKQVIHTTIKN